MPSGVYKRTKKCHKKRPKHSKFMKEQWREPSSSYNALKYREKSSEIKKGKTKGELGHKIETCQCPFCKAARGELKHSARTKKKISKIKKGKPLSENHKEAIKEAMNHPDVKRRHKMIMKEVTNRPDVRRKNSLSKTGENNYWCGKKRPEHSRKMSGENHFNWQGGVSFEPYGKEFNDELKLFIRQRDNFTCQFCGIRESGRAHDVHHIDHDKKNGSELNLITLCQEHNKSANYNRDKWQFLFETLQEIRLV